MSINQFACAVRTVMSLNICEIPLMTGEHVVTAFVQRADTKLLVVQRSDKVGSFQRQWGGVSGYIEPEDTNLLQRALAEVQEEVGFPECAVDFVRQGRPLLVDASPTRSFAVHPVLLATRGTPPEPVLNWENIDTNWVNRAEIAQLAHVPQLPETAARLLLEPAQEAALQRIGADRSHGAAQLAMWALQALEDHVHARRVTVPAGPTAAAELTALANYAYHLAVSRPAMASLANVAVDVTAGVREKLPEAPCAREDVWNLAEQVIGERRASLEAVSAKLLKAALDALPQQATVLTLSLSSTILQVLQALHTKGRCKGVIVCESRPLFEGVALAEKLTSAGMQVTVVTDAQAALFMKQAGCVIIGADAVTEQGVSNKVGSHLIALAAKAAGVLVYAIGDSSKITAGPITELVHPLPPTPPKHPLEHTREGRVFEVEGEEKGASEVTDGWPESADADTRSRLVVRNMYFEETSWQLLKGLITEDGMIGVTEIQRVVQKRRERVLQAFLF